MPLPPTLLMYAPPILAILAGALAALTGFSTAWAVVFLEVGRAVAAAGCATLLARRWAMRSWLGAVAQAAQVAHCS